MHPYFALLWETVTIEFMIKFFVIYFFVVWIALIVWVAKDISHRSQSRLLQILCVLIMVLFTPFWVFLYLLIRPGKSLYESYTSEIEENLWILSEIVEERIGQEKTSDMCPECMEDIESDFIICPSCKYELKNTCVECHKEIRKTWKVCPYCQTKQKNKKEKKTD